MDSPAKCFKKQESDCCDPSKLLISLKALCFFNILEVTSEVHMLLAFILLFLFCMNASSALFISFDNGWRIRFYFQLFLSMF